MRPVMCSAYLVFKAILKLTAHPDDWVGSRELAAHMNARQDNVSAVLHRLWRHKRVRRLRDGVTSRGFVYRVSERGMRWFDYKERKYWEEEE
jgi:DNA-binding MarR family transcriptional regulator